MTETPANTVGEELAKQTERRALAQQFLRDELADGPKRVSDVEDAAEKASANAGAGARRSPRCHQPRQYRRSAGRAVELARLR
jgi:hypothetical protein